MTCFLSHRPRSVLTRGLLLLAGVLALGACGNPVPDDLRSSLGPESPSIPVGPLHRAGQPCLACHDGSNAIAFSVAGTAYITQDATAPLVDGVVTVTDAAGGNRWATANCNGNFYILADDYQPTYPFQVSVSLADQNVTMDSLVHRDGSCATCHADPAGAQSAGHVYLTNLPDPPTVRSCQ